MFINCRDFFEIAFTRKKTLQIKNSCGGCSSRVTGLALGLIFGQFLLIGF